MTDREAACELYETLDALMGLFKRRKIPLPAVKWPTLEPGDDPAIAISVSTLPTEQQEGMYIIRVLAEADATLEALRETYGDTTASS